MGFVIAISKFRSFGALFTKTTKMTAVKVRQQEAHRQRIADLLHTHVSDQKIMGVTGAGRMTIYRVKKRLEAGKSLQKKSRPAVTKKLTEDFVSDLKASFEATPNVSIRKMAKTKKVHEKTIRTGLKTLGMASKVQPRRQLLTAKQKEARVLKCKRLRSALKKKARSTVIIVSYCTVWWQQVEFPQYHTSNE